MRKNALNFGQIKIVFGNKIFSVIGRRTLC